MDYKKDTFGIDLGDHFEINLFEISKNRTYKQIYFHGIFIRINHWDNILKK